MRCFVSYLPRISRHNAPSTDYRLWLLFHFPLVIHRQPTSRSTSTPSRCKAHLQASDLMQLFSVSGGLPVKQRASQRQAYRLIEMECWRRLRGIPIVPHPKFYPANASLAHRVLLAAIEEDGHNSESVQMFARRGLKTVWADEGHIADETTIATVANASGLDGERLVEYAKSRLSLAEAERKLTKEAIDLGYFGNPVYVYRGEPFWGQDRLEMLEDVISSGREPVTLESVVGKEL